MTDCRMCCRRIWSEQGFGLRIDGVCVFYIFLSCFNTFCVHVYGMCEDYLHIMQFLFSKQKNMEEARRLNSGVYRIAKHL